jgi:hypothetical protein
VLEKYVEHRKDKLFELFHGILFARNCSPTELDTSVLVIALEPTEMYKVPKSEFSTYFDSRALAAAYGQRILFNVKVLNLVYVSHVYRTGLILAYVM